MSTNPTHYRHRDAVHAKDSPYIILPGRVARVRDSRKFVAGGLDPETGLQTMLWPLPNVRLKADHSATAYAKLDTADFMEIAARYGLASLIPEVYRGALHRVLLHTCVSEQPKVTLARLIAGNFKLGEPRKRIVRHKNGDPLDLRRINLEIIQGGRGGVSDKIKKRASKAEHCAGARPSAPAEAEGCAEQCAEEARP